MRSFQDSSSPGAANSNKAKGRTGRCRRRRALSLSRQAVQALTTLDATVSSFDYIIPSSLSNNRVIVDANKNKSSKKKNHHHQQQQQQQQLQLALLERDDSKASMVYDVPFDPITGQCNYHPTVCMAVKMTEEEEKEKDESTSENRGVVVGHRGRVQQQSTTVAATVVVGGWKIVRTRCPKCMYNY